MDRRPITWFNDLQAGETVLGLGLSHSRGAYHTTLAPCHDVLHTMLDVAEKHGS